VRGWLAVIAQRHKTGQSKETALRLAWEQLARGNPFPATMGRICPHPCESACSRRDKDDPVAIHALERFLGDWAINSGLRLAKDPEAPERERVGVIGGGPAGLSFAYQMARRGYRVTIYERSARLGGMLFHGIPEFRLPERILEAEIRRILDLGVEVRFETCVGLDVSVAELRETHAAIFIGIGAQRGRGLGVPGEEGPGVLAGTDFLAAVNRGNPPPLGRRVVVVGGGNTAMDAARAARRLGAAVTILYRRSIAEMPAIAEEVEESIAEGVDLVLLAAPTQLIREAGVLVAVEVQRMRLAETDASGRRSPVPIEGQTLRLPADSVIAAVAQEPDWMHLDGIQPAGLWVQGEPDAEMASAVWAGGDVRGLGIAGMAIAQGRQAAETVHRRLRGIDREVAADRRERVAPGDVKLQFYVDHGPVVPPVSSVAERLAEPEREAVGTIDEEQFLAEADRCLSCGLCFGCQHCWSYCNGFGFTRVAAPGPGNYFTLSLERCEQCGECIDICPSGFLSPRPAHPVA
jgi:NADPH-dependent glutamate synthase beta subunit-like oxidoreductase